MAPTNDEKENMMMQTARRANQDEVDMEEEEEEEGGGNGGRGRKRASGAASSSNGKGGRPPKRRPSVEGAGGAQQQQQREEEEEKEEEEEEEEQQPQQQQQQQQQRAKKKGTGAAADDMEQDEREEEEEEDSDDDSEDDETTRQLGSMRQKRYAVVNVAGKPAEAGVIVKVYCENFMCHRKLSITLCSNVNFIHGQNGSGKSAILAALQICLGARANVTHRGSKLGDMIRQGHDGHALVRVSLLNKGADAFEHDKYGNYITIERKIERHTSGCGYRLLKGDPHQQGVAHMQLVSKKKEDLDRMLDLFNIQIENPCALLDQENAKKFIQGDGGEKFRFFERATVCRVWRGGREGGREGGRACRRW